VDESPLLCGTQNGLIFVFSLEMVAAAACSGNGCGAGGEVACGGFPLVDGIQ
jgi:hypothetical protein